MSLPLARSESLNRPSFNTRDSTLDITESFQQSANQLPSSQVFRAISRDTFSKSSSSDDLPSAGELKENINRYTSNRWSLDYEPELDSLANGIDNQNRELGSANRLAVPPIYGNEDQPATLVNSKGSGKVYDTLYNPPSYQRSYASLRKVPPVKPTPLRPEPVAPVEDEVKLCDSNGGLMSQFEPELLQKKPPNAVTYLSEKDVEPVGLETKTPSRAEINERVTKSMQGPKSIIYEAYFIFGVLCGIICLTVLIAETDRPTIRPPVIGQSPTDKDKKEIVQLTNSWAAWLRDTRLFGAFHEAVYAPIKERLLFHFSWMFQI